MVGHHTPTNIISYAGSHTDLYFVATKILSHLSWSRSMPAAPHTAPGAIRVYVAQRGHIFVIPIYDIQAVFYNGM